MSKSKRYDKAFKEEAVRLSYEKNSIMDVAREVGVSYGTIVRWRKGYAGKMDDNPIKELMEEDSKNAAMGVCILFGWLWPFW